MTARGRGGESESSQNAAELSDEITSQEFQQSLQKDISQAIEPVIRDLQDEIVQVVRQQMENRNAPEEGQGDPASSQEAFAQAGEALRETFERLGKTLRTLLQTVRSLLKAVGALLRALLSGPVSGIRSIKDAIQDRVIGAVVNRVRQWVQSLIRRIMSWFIPGVPVESPVES